MADSSAELCIVPVSVMYRSGKGPCGGGSVGLCEVAVMLRILQCR